MPPLFHRHRPSSTALLAGVLMLLAACGGGDPTGPGEPTPVPGDTDHDGFAPPADCYDGPFAWSSVGSPCDGSDPLRFVPHDRVRANDFTLAEWKGRLHVVHIRTQGAWWLPGNAVDFGHETSFDMRRWSARPDVQLRGAAGAWNDRNVWSPHLVRAGDRWALFYTGVTYGADPEHNLQRIGLVFSDDLRSFAAPSSPIAGVEGNGCVLDGSAAWTTWGSAEPWAGDCRDPFVLPVDDGWVMLLTVRLARAGRPQAIARAVSPDLLHWRLVDMIEATVGSVAESAAIARTPLGYVLMWTASSGQRWAWGTDLLGLFTLEGAAPGGYACELLPLEDGSFLFASVQGYGIDLGRLDIVRADAARPPAPPVSATPAPELRLSTAVARECQVPGASIHPGAADPRNGLDDNCDGLVDAVRPIERRPRDHSLEPRERRPALEPAKGRW